MNASCGMFSSVTRAKGKPSGLLIRCAGFHASRPFSYRRQRIRVPSTHSRPRIYAAGRDISTMTLRERLSEAFSKAPRMHKDAGQRLALASPKTPEYERWSEETFGIVEVTPTIEHPGIPDDAPL